jgi:2-methylisocitrate lyase-like PEP mutase family enzyme
VKTRPSTRLRELLAEGTTIVKPGAFNALSAMVIERAGFKAVGVSGYGVAASLLGKPDAGLTTLTEVVMVTRYVVDAVSIPVIADADTGYGNAINTMRATADFIRAGAASIHVEDQIAPKRCGHVSGKQIIPLDEAIGKFRAAAKVRDELDLDFVLIARTDARGVVGGSVEEVIRRGNAYLEAGADMVFPEGLASEEELERVCREIDGPIHYNRGGVSPRVPVARLQELGVAIVSNAGGALRASTRGMWDYMHSFREDDVEFLSRDADAMRGHPLEDFHGFIGFPEIMELEREYLPAEDVSARYDGSLGYDASPESARRSQIV